MTDPQPARVAIVSHRQVDQFVSRTGTYEFEDLIASVDAADLLSVNARPWSRLAMRAERSAPGLLAAWGQRQIPADRRYELLYVSVHTVTELARMQPLNAFLACAERTAINVDEMWLKNLESRSGELALLSRFDFIFTTSAHSVDALSRATGRPCFHLPPGVDALRFAPPASGGLPRTIDVYYMGRQRPALHAALREVCSRSRRFYLFDTASPREARSYVEHRAALAGLIQRSKYFVVDVAKADWVNEIEGQEEVGQRYFEGAAAGAVLIGFAPRTRPFATLFGWQDAVIPVAPRAEAVDAVLSDLDASPERVAAIRRANVSHVLRHHDSAYRWELILRAVGLDPLPALAERVQKLSLAAKAIESSEVEL